MRWCTRDEILSGKGQLVCGNVACSNKDKLTWLEVHFAYVEENIAKDELVKVRLCPTCSYLMNYDVIQQIKQHTRRRQQDSSTRPSTHIDSSDTNGAGDNVDVIELD